MSFKLPFNLQSIQESLNYDNISKSFQKVNPGKYSDQFKESIQPFANKTTQLISSQLQQLQQLSSLNGNVEVSELPVEYLELENSCDALFKLYTDLIHFNEQVYGKVSYDYPPGNYALTKLRESNVSSVISSKFNQLRNVSSPQEIEKILLGGSNDEEAHTQTTSSQLPKTLFGQLSQIAQTHSEELKNSSNALSLGLLKVSSSYLEIADARLSMDSKIMKELNSQLVQILNDQFIKVNELRKRVYATRLQFDQLRATVSENEEDEELIKIEDELVSATEAAVSEMKILLKPAQSVSLLKTLATAQKEWFEVGQQKLTSLIAELDKIDTASEDD